MLPQRHRNIPRNFWDCIYRHSAGQSLLSLQALILRNWPGAPCAAVCLRPSLDNLLHAQDYLPGSAVNDVVRLVVRVISVPQVHELLPSAFQPELHLSYLHVDGREGLKSNGIASESGCRIYTLHRFMP